MIDWQEYYESVDLHKVYSGVRMTREYWLACKARLAVSMISGEQYQALEAARRTDFIEQHFLQARAA